MSESEKPSPNHLGGLINGILDVQLMFIMQLSHLFKIEPAHFAEILANLAEAAEKQGGPPEFVSSRRFAPDSLRETLRYIALRQASSGKTRFPYEIIAGGLLDAKAFDQPERETDVDRER